MSPSLQGEVAYAANAHWLMGVWYFANCSERFLSAICLKLHSKVFAQGEPFGDIQVLYVLCKGIVLINGRVLREHGVWVRRR